MSKTPKPFAELKEKNHALFKQAVLEQRELVEHHPPLIILESTSKCNFRCTMCPLFGNDEKGHDFDRGLFDRRVLPLLPFANEIMLQVIGEPLLSKNFDYFYGQALEHGVRPIFVTNGSRLDEEKIRRFVRDGVTMMFSLDGITPDTLSVTRPEAKLDQLFDNLDLIGRISREHPDSGFFFVLISILSRCNVHEFPLLVDYAHRWNVKNLQINELVLLGNAPNSIRGVQLQEEDIENNAGLFELGKKKAVEYGIELTLPKRFRGVGFKLVNTDVLKPLFDKKRREANPYPGICLSPWKEILFTVNGDVRPCCFSQDILGSLCQEDFQTIWNGERMREYRRTVNSATPLRPCDLCSNPVAINLGSPRYIKKTSPSGV